MIQSVLYILLLCFVHQIICEVEKPLLDDWRYKMLTLLSGVLSEEADSLEDSFKPVSREDSNDITSKEEDSYEDYEPLEDNSEESAMNDKESLKQYILELLSESKADLFGTNPHYKQPKMYKDLGRRFVLQYPYNEISTTSKSGESVRIIPQAAPPELVLDVAKKSALLDASQPLNPTDEVIRKEILRTGEYWNNVWREDVDSNALRSSNKNKNNLETIRVKVTPSSNLYNIIAKLKQISPKVLYIINKNKS